jgi:hypothetical protein
MAKAATSTKSRFARLARTMALNIVASSANLIDELGGFDDDAIACLDA